MLKTLTLSLSLAVALGLCSVSKAGGLFHNNDGCSTCGIASPQCSPQGPVVASPQGVCGPVCGNECVAKKKCHFLDACSGLGNKMSCNFHDLCAKMKPKPPVYTYEWVLKKKRVWCHKSNPCGSPACETCAPYPSGQGAPSPQAGYSSPQAWGSGQATYGATSYAAPMMPHAGAMTPAAAGDEAPPPPEIGNPMPSAPSTPSIPAPPAPPAPPGATSGLLFSTPSAN